MAIGGPLACPRGDGRDCVLGAHGQAGSWGPTLLSCTLSPKQKGKRCLMPTERVVRVKSVLERKDGDGGADPEPPSKRVCVDHRPWPVYHRSNAKHVFERQNAGGTIWCCISFVLVPWCLHGATWCSLGHWMEMARSCWAGVFGCAGHRLQLVSCGEDCA